MDKLSIAGACQATVTGFQSESSLDLSVVGASGMEINGFKAADTHISIVGASHLTGSLITGTCNVDVTGASNIKLTGSTSNLDLSVVGASHAGLTDFVVDGDASVAAIGASNADVEVHGTLDISVSGVSTLTYGDSPKLGKVEVSGVSTLKRR
jgi:hypothetical protein